jgi:hypothetical protein
MFSDQSRRVKELSVIRISVLTFALLAAFTPGMGRAQTNIDQGKSASQIFASACVDCHKAPHGLARGKNSWALTEFLSGHYTTSRDQAAALAAYVVGRGHAVAAPTPGQDAKLPAKPTKQQEAASPRDIFQRLFNPTIRPEPRPTAAASRRKEPKAPKPSLEMPEPAADAHAQSVGSAMPEPAADTHDEPTAAVAQPARSMTPEPAAETHEEPDAAVAQPATSVTSEPATGTDEPAVAGPGKEEVAAPADNVLPKAGEATSGPRDDVPD